MWSSGKSRSVLLKFLILMFIVCRHNVSPFEYALGESGGSLQLAVVNAQIKWPPGPDPPYPEALHQFVVWMLQPQLTVRPHIDDVIIHVDKLMLKYS
jgi:serine/threonine kinase 16